MSIEGPDEARVVVGMKGLEEFISHERRKDPLLGPRSPAIGTRRRIHRTRWDESHRRSVWHTSVCTPTRGGGRTRARTLSREDHSFHVSQARKNVICSLSADDQSSQRRTERLHAGVIATEDETTNRRGILAADGHLCVHTIGSFGLLGLGHSFHVPQPKIDRMHTGKTGAFVFTNAATRNETLM